MIEQSALHVSTAQPIRPLIMPAKLMHSLLATTLLLGLCFSASASAASTQPNILFIFCDDLTNQSISAYGHKLKLLETPHMDRIAKEGIRFERCVVPNSICGPSRAVIQTGKYSHINGFYHNGSVFNGDQPTVQKMLKAGGYQTAVIGKWHLVSDPQGFDHWHILPGQGIYYNPPMIRDGEKVEHTGYTTDLIGDFSLEWLKKRDKTKPFFLMSQHKAPHREWAPALRHLGWNGDREFPEPETLFDDYAGRGRAEAEQDMSLEKTITRRDSKEDAPPYLNEEQLKVWNAYYEPRNEAMRQASLSGQDIVRWRYQRYMHDYLGTVKAVDENVGRLLDYLDEEGIADNTLVILSSDQGFYLGEHGWFDKRWIYEESLTTPLLMRWPGVITPGSSASPMTSIIDFPETFLEVAGLPVPADMQGRSLLPLMKGQTPDDWRKSFYYHYYEFPGAHSVRKHYGVVTDRYKLFHFYEKEMDYWTLMDRETDPNEMTNVYAKPEYSDTVKELHAELDRLRSELKVPSEDAPESFSRMGGGGKAQGKAKGPAKGKGKAN
jgi:arylsulfatase A-like enzyme